MESQDTEHQCTCCGHCSCSTEKKEEKPFVSGSEDMTLTQNDKAKIDEYHKQTS